MSYPSCFTLVEKRDIPEQKMTALRFRHECGMDILCLETDDVENLFVLGFTTNPMDSTGAAHIVEHSVLGGSRKYPVKDPFIELVKSSMATFINAMTYPDRTVYPASTCVKQDFFNLWDVYWDAVFHPNISEDGFKQEGWHYEVSGKGRGLKLVRNGIVLNEMSGYYSSFDTILERCVSQFLFPDTYHVHDSGGEPSVIPTLTYKKFRAFYKKYYAPGRCHLLLYGNISTEEKLNFIAQHLSEEKALEVCSPAKPARRQKRWKQAQAHRDYFMPEHPGDNKGALAFTWFIDDDRNLELDLSMQLLDFILEGNAGAPLSKALMASGLGTKMIDGGFDNCSRETIFQVGMRGVREQDFDALEELIVNCLADVVRKGLTQEQLQTAIRQFRLDEQRIDKYHCIDIMEDVMCNWNYGKDPLLFLDKQAAWKNVEAKVLAGDGYMESLIQKHLLENPHRLRLELCPDKDYVKKNKAEEAEELALLQKTFTKEELEKIKADMERLKQKLDRVNTPEELATLPKLSTAQLPRKAIVVPAEEIVLAGGTPFIVGKVPTNGICYFNVRFDLDDMPSRFRKTLPLFSRLFARVGIKGCSYDKMAARQALASTVLATRLEGGALDRLGRGPGHLGMSIVLCSLEECCKDAAEIMMDSWNSKVFSEHKRIHEILRQTWTSIVEGLMHSRDEAAKRAGAGLTVDGTINELWYGWTADAACRDLAAQSVPALAKAEEELDELMAWLRGRRPMIGAYVGGDGGLSIAENTVQAFNEKGKMGENGKEEWLWNNKAEGRRELLAMDSNVSSCARALRSPGLLDKRVPALNVGAHLLNCGYLWNEVRAKNGAYGVGCYFNFPSRIFCLRSSEDPRPMNTIEVFNKLPTLGIERTWTKEEIDSGILSLAKGAFRPWLPEVLLDTAIGLKLNKITSDMRDEQWENLLELTPEKVRKTWENYWDEFGSEGNDAAVGPEKQFDKAGFTVEKL